MKNFIRKSFIVAVTAFAATASQAGVDCGSHMVLNVYQGGDHGTILFAVTNKTDGAVTNGITNFAKTKTDGTYTNSTVTKYARPEMSVFNTSDKVRTLVSLVTAAKLADRTLRIHVADGGSCSEGEYRAYAVVLE